MTEIVTIFLLFLLGAGVGSFLYALSDRLIFKSKSRRSSCDHCHHRLKAGDLVPILSFMVLRGKCRYCHKKISPLGFLLEILTASLFALSYSFWPIGELNSILTVILFGLWLIILSGLILLFICDIRIKKLFNLVICWTLVFSIIFAIVNGILVNQMSSLELAKSFLFSLLPVTGVYGMVWLMSKGRLTGLGDVKLGIIIAVLLPWQGSLAVLLLANLLAAVIILPQLVMKKLKLNTKIVFGPFLITATIAVFFSVKFFVNLF
jgi:leader peptidase (prepilin peptidase)/N-methyltransferase